MYIDLLAGDSTVLAHSEHLSLLVLTLSNLHQFHLYLYQLDRLVNTEVQGLVLEL